MHGSVIAVAELLMAVAAGLLWFDRDASPDPRPDALRVAAIDTPSRAVAASVPSTPPTAAVPATPPRAAINRYLSDDRLLDLFETLRHSAAGNDLFVAKRIEL